ncbi:uncharacterized protein B0I36DRAFT_396638, partial [Microdochium trichocladiopsis]
IVVRVALTLHHFLPTIQSVTTSKQKSCESTVWPWLRGHPGLGRPATGPGMGTTENRVYDCKALSLVGPVEKYDDIARASYLSDTGNSCIIPYNMIVIVKTKLVYMECSG